MKKHIISGVKLTALCLVFFSGIYTLFILGIAQITPNKGKGEIVEVNGKKQYANIGQSFTDNKYFIVKGWQDGADFTQ